jgi:hypothetical protein
MLRIISGVLVAATLAQPAVAAKDHAKRHPKVVWHGYGFLPGYRPPEQIERQTPRAPTGHYFYGDPGYNFYGGPGFYRGRWNGGGFGECWTQTPIGPHWNCG